jgi:hypothetical protein
MNVNSWMTLLSAVALTFQVALVKLVVPRVPVINEFGPPEIE